MIGDFRDKFLLTTDVTGLVNRYIRKEVELIGWNNANVEFLTLRNKLILDMN